MRMVENSSGMEMDTLVRAHPCIESKSWQEKVPSLTLHGATFLAIGHSRKPHIITMGKDKSEKKDKKEKKEKRAEVDGVKKSKKEKKDKKERSPKEVNAILSEVKVNGAAKDADDIKDEEMAELKVVPKEALVPFANPLADEKQTKKVLKSVKKGMPCAVPSTCMQTDILINIGQRPSTKLSSAA